jgi:prepilin peptidase CpaA
MWHLPLCDFHMRPLAWYVAIATALAAAILDVRSRRVPNWLSGPVLLSGLIWAAYSGGAAAAADSLAGCLVLALPYVLLFVFAGGGAGDAKLMGALGAWLGLMNGGLVLFAVALSGVVLGMGTAVARKQTSTVLVNLRQISGSMLFLRHRQGGLSDMHGLLPKSEEMQTMPYGLAILAGVCMAAGGVFIWH